MSPLMVTILVFLMSVFKSHTVSLIPTYNQNFIIDVTQQGRLQPLDAHMFATVGRRQARIPDIATTEDSYIEALRYSRNSHRKSSAPTVHHPHADRDGGSGIFQGTNHQYNNDIFAAPLTYEYASTSRPLTAMEKNYLKPKKLPPVGKTVDTVDKTVDSIDIESSNDEEELEDEDQPEDQIESDASSQFIHLIGRPYYSAASAKSVYSKHLANWAKLANRKHDDIIVVEKNEDEKHNIKILTKKKLISVRLPDAMEIITNKAAGALRNSIKTAASTAGLSSMLDNLTNRVNRWLPAASSVGHRKKRSVLLDSDERKNNNHDMKKRHSVNDANQMSSINNLALRFHFRKLSPNSERAITSAHSSAKRLATSKFKNLKATQLKQMVPWFYTKFVKNQKRTTSQEAGDMEQNEKFLDTGDDKTVTLTSFLLSQKPIDSAKVSVQDTLSKKEGLVHVDNSKFTHGHGIIVQSDHVSTSNTVIKDTVSHGTVYSDDLSTYTHGHGVVMPNAPVQDKPSLGESSLVSDVVDNQNILSQLVNGTASSSSNQTEGHDDVETNETSSPLDPLIASLDGPVLTTGIFSDEIDLALDDLESLMTDIIIAPLQVEAVVAEDGSSNENEVVAESPSDSSDSVIIEAAEENQPESIPVVSNLVNSLITSSGSSVSSSSSSSSSSSGSISSGGIVGGDSSAVSADPFALLNTIGLAAIGIFVLTLPIWIPMVVAQMKKRRNSFSRRSPFVFPIGSFNNDAEFHPYSTLLRKLTPSDATFANPGPLNSEDLYGPTSVSYFGRKAARRRRSNRRTTFQL